MQEPNKTNSILVYYAYNDWIIIVLFPHCVNWTKDTKEREFLKTQWESQFDCNSDNFPSYDVKRCIN